MRTTTTTEITLGEYMTSVYDELLEIYGDPDLASVAAAAMVNDLLAERAEAEQSLATPVAA